MKENEINILDQEAHILYGKYRESKLLHPKNRIIQTSDPDVLVDPLSSFNHITRKISHLPSQEIDQILATAQSAHVLRAKAKEVYKRAYGESPNKSITQKTISYQILDTHFSQLVEYFGMMYSLKEVQQILTKEYGYDISNKTIEEWRNDNIDTIKAKQELHKKDYGDIRLSHKKSRLQEYEYLYNDRLSIYKKTKNRDDYKVLLDTLKLVKSEVEVDTIRIDGNIEHNVNHVITHQIEKQVLQQMTLNDIIIARVAGKLGVGVPYLVNRLNQSYYAKFSGIAKPDTDNPQDQTPIYPSSIVYNWDKIKETHKTKNELDNDLKKEDPIDIESLSPTKLALLNAVNKLKGQIQDQQRVIHIKPE